MFSLGSYPQHSEVPTEFVERLNRTETLLQSETEFLAMVVVIFCTNVFGQVSAFEQKATSVTLSTSFCGGGVEEEGS